MHLNLNVSIFIYFLVYLTGNVQCGDVVCQEAIQQTAKTFAFSYKPSSPIGPSCWHTISPSCSGDKQSPINIVKSKAKKIEASKKLQCSKWNETPVKVNAENTGMIIKFEFFYEDGNRPIFYPTPITNIATVAYELDSVQLHIIGAEHLFDNTLDEFDIEAHVIFYKMEHGSFEKALNQPDGVIVVAKFLKMADNQHNNFTVFSKVKYPFETYRLKDSEIFSLGHIFGSVSSDFYTYIGSLTTPKCNEGVRFILDYGSHLTVATNVVADLHNILGTEGRMSKNIRPLQSQNSRVVEFYKYQPSSEERVNRRTWKRNQKKASCGKRRRK